VKKSILAIGIMCTVLSVTQWAEKKTDHPQYANIFITVWQLENDHSDFLSKLQAPIPEVYAESWLYSSFYQDISDGELRTKSLEKEKFRFDLTTGKPDELTIQVWETGKVIFKNIHQRSSTLRTIFYDSSSRPFLLEVCFSCSDHPVGIFGIGPRKIT